MVEPEEAAPAYDEGSGLLGWMRRGVGSSAGGLSGVLGPIADIFDPGAIRLREHQEREHEIALPKPTPGDKLLEEKKIVIRRRAEG